MSMFVFMKIKNSARPIKNSSVLVRFNAWMPGGSGLIIHKVSVITAGVSKYSVFQLLILSSNLLKTQIPYVQLGARGRLLTHFVGHIGFAISIFTN